MSFLNPGFLYLAPLLALPVLIHLLNRIRYRRVRWAAIEFLLTSEQRAVRRAKLQQLLLMALRTLLLAAVLGALLQPIFRGQLAALLGGSSQVAVMVDASASMSTSGASGSAFDRAKQQAADGIDGLPGRARVTAGTFATGYESPFHEPLLDHDAVKSAITRATLTAGPADVPSAICEAAESLARTGGGGTIWILTDLHADGWRSTDPARWQQVRQALDRAGKPRVIVSDVSGPVEANLSITGARVKEAVLLKKDKPELTVTVRNHAPGGAVANLSLFFDEKRVDSCSVQFDEAGRNEYVFQLPALSRDVHVGRLELDRDARPADDQFHFLIRTTTHIPVLVVDGAPSTNLQKGASYFVSRALEPAEEGEGVRSAFAPKVIPVSQLTTMPLGEYAAVFLADATHLDPRAVASLSDYASAGGMVVLFPGRQTDVASWNRINFFGVSAEAVVEADRNQAIKVVATDENDPLTRRMPLEGVDLLRIYRMLRFAKDAAGKVLATTDNGDAFLIRSQVGKGKVYSFAVSCQRDGSSFPVDALFLMTVHRAMKMHVIETVKPLSRPAFTQLRLALPPGQHQIKTPDGRTLPVQTPEGVVGQAFFDQTGQAGVYRLMGQTPAPTEGDAAGEPVVAINTAPSQSELKRIEPSRIQTLLAGYDVSFTSTNGGSGSLGQGKSTQTASSSFPLAMLAILFLLSEVLLAWRIGRPRKVPDEEAAPAVPPQAA